MDNSGDRVALSGEGEAAARLLNMSQAVVGCPTWCSWAVDQPDHHHCVSEGAELVLGYARHCESGLEVEILLEVRHTPQSARSGISFALA